jgi:signal transduction histidine kinase
VMQKHGGTIALTSQPGQVTTFTLTLPIHQHNPAQALE